MNGVSRPTVVMAGFSRLFGSSMVFSGLGIFGFGFTQQTIAIGVELFELLWRPEELAGRKLAVAADVHVAEPALWRQALYLIGACDKPAHPPTRSRLASDER